jgi:tRNA/tmRNA/rRNA uracil-C5-methylase (TrmA/RlmC/RlmD family)
MKLAVELSEAETARLKEAAARLGVDPTELARAAISEFLSTPDDDFRAAADHVLRRNEELYRRLS